MAKEMANTQEQTQTMYTYKHFSETQKRSWGTSDINKHAKGVRDKLKS